jgi:hypothetical protein
LEDRFATDSIDVLWDSSNEYVVIRDRTRKLPAIQVNFKTELSSYIVNGYPRYYHDNLAIMEDAGGKIYFVDHNKELEYSAKSGHFYSISRDGRYLIYGWSRGMDRETLTIEDVETQKKYQIKLNDLGTVLGLALW